LTADGPEDEDEGKDALGSVARFEEVSGATVELGVPSFEILLLFFTNVFVPLGVVIFSFLILPVFSSVIPNAFFAAFVQFTHS
jgi:hypothetical protein